MRHQATIVGFVILALSALAMGTGWLAATPTISAADGTPMAAQLTGVTSEILARGEPAPPLGDDLALGQVTIAPGASIPAHEHPGTQLAVILSGELTYSVLTGAVPVTRAGEVAASGAAEPSEVITAGNTVILRPGDSVKEQPGAIHQARNDGAEPVVILLAMLFASEEPRTIFVEATPTR